MEVIVLAFLVFEMGALPRVKGGGERVRKGACEEGGGTRHERASAGARDGARELAIRGRVAIWEGARLDARHARRGIAMNGRVCIAFSIILGIGIVACSDAEKERGPNIELVEQQDGGARRGTPESCEDVRGGPKMVYVETPSGIGYCIDETPVTQAQYAEFLASVKSKPGSEHKKCSGNMTYEPELPECFISSRGDKPSEEDFYTPDLTPDRPIFCVDWCDAVAFCQWAGKRLCGKGRWRSCRPPEGADWHRPGRLQPMVQRLLQRRRDARSLWEWHRSGSLRYRRRRYVEARREKPFSVPRGGWRFRRGLRHDGAVG